MRERSLLRLAYVLGALLVLLPLVDLAANAWPWAPAELNWRYGTYTLVSGFLMTPVIGLALMGGAAVVGGNRGAGRAIAVVAGLLVLGLLGGTALFTLDAIQLNTTVPDAAAAQFRIGVGKALFKNIAMVVGLVVVTLVSWRRPGRTPLYRRPRSEKEKPSPLVAATER